MIIKLKHIAACLTVGLIAASCSQSDSPSPYDSPTTYIQFGVPTINLDATVGNFADRVGSRATLVDAVESFYVWGFCVPQDIDNQQNQASAPKPWVEKSIFFTNGADLKNLNKTVVTLNSISTTYNGGTLTEWNTNPTALSSFIAVSGNVDSKMDPSNNSTDPKQSHGPRLTLTLKTTGNNVNTPLDYTQQPDALVAATFDRESRDGLVNLSFFHIMTGIRFKFHNYNENQKLTIKKVTYKGTFYKQAVFDFTDDEPVMTVPTDPNDPTNPTYTYSGTFTLLDSPQEIAGASSDYIQIPSSYMGGDETPATLLLLPNPAGTTADDNNYTLGTNKEIEITYTVGDDNAERTFKLENFVLNYKPTANTLHTAHFNFVGDQFMVMFQADDVLNWENGSDNKVVIN